MTKRDAAKPLARRGPKPAPNAKTPAARGDERSRADFRPARLRTTTIVPEGCDSDQGPLTTVRKWRRIAHRETSFVSSMAGTVALADVLRGLGADVRRVFLVGARPGAGTAQGFRSWAFGDLPDGWKQGERQHMESASSPLLEYFRPDGVRVHVSRAASWFGEGNYDAADATAAYDATRALIETRFDGCTLLDTPSTTGRELFVHEIPDGHAYPVLSVELQELIRDTTGQHRYDPTDDELAARGGDLPGLYEYDGRFMYAALAWGLPVGVPTRDTCSDFAGKARARYRVTFRVPREWCHLGLLGVKAGADRWRYARRPNETGAAWCSGSELELAYARGWEITIHERLIWETGKPLDKWAGKLVAARESVTGTDRVSALVRAALRQLLITSVGAFHGTPRPVTHEAPLSAPRPRGEHVKNLRAEGDHWVWSELDTGGGWAELRHPEWSAEIWARGRRRLLDAPTGARGIRAGALHVPPAELVALRADAVYVIAEQPWPDDGSVGRFRLVRAVRGPLSAPRSHTELLRARGGSC